MADFPRSEFEARLERAQALMAADNLDFLFLTTEAEFRYFSGFRSLFWQSPARPWFLLIPAEGEPIAVIPSIGEDLMRQNWISDIRCWDSPNPDDEGISLLTAALGGAARIGLPMGQEASLRMPLADFERLKRALNAEFCNATPLVQALRMVKSPAEISVISEICGIASNAFSRADELFSAGQPVSQAFRDFRVALLQAGADDVPYLVGGAGQGGYGDVISPPTDAPLREGDVLMLDTGSTRNGYFCDFDRNFAIGNADEHARAAHRALWAATEAGLKASHPGTSCSALFAAMAAELPGDGSSVGRFGHGLGMQLTEWPSIAAGDHTVLKPGMVMTLEPSMQIGPEKMMVHEENILITEDAPVLLTRRADPELPVI